MAELPAGTVTFLFTDVERSTRLLARARRGRVRKRARGASAAPPRGLRARGHEVDTQGDSLFYAFARADDAVAAAADGQRALDGLPLRVRMGIHTGQPAIIGDGYVGLDVHRAARICAAAHGGQVVLSQTTRDLAERRDARSRRASPQGPDAAAAAVPARRDRPRDASSRRCGRSRTGRRTCRRRRRRSSAARAEVDALAALLADDAVRLVTLTGPGGTGKTRLALHAAAEAVELFPNGVWFVALEAVHDPALLLPTIAQTLGLLRVAATGRSRRRFTSTSPRSACCSCSTTSSSCSTRRARSRDLLDAAPA